MIALLNVVLLVGTIVLGIPTVMFCVECLLGLLPRRLRLDSSAGKHPRTAVVVPAHNENSIIGPTVEHLRQQIGAGDVLLVVADNCSDDTARTARDKGATVIERADPEHRGKGYALSFATAYLREHETPEAVVIIDADCRISKGGIARLASLAVESQRPVQADYTLTATPGASPAARLSAFAFRVRNRVRPLGLLRMGGAVHLAGTGMGIPWDVFASAPAMRDHLTEDLALGVELTLTGHGPLPCPDVHVTSDLAPSRAGQVTQRQRWESGHLQTLTRYVPRLLGRALTERRPRLLLSACDLAIPPLAMLVMLLLAGCAVSLLGLVLGASPLSTVILGVEVVVTATAIGLLWLVAGRDVLRFADWLSLPFYVASKLPSYMQLLGRGRHLSWKKTDRND